MEQRWKAAHSNTTSRLPFYSFFLPFFWGGGGGPCLTIHSFYLFLGYQANIISSSQTHIEHPHATGSGVSVGCTGTHALRCAACGVYGIGTCRRAGSQLGKQSHALLWLRIQTNFSPTLKIIRPRGRANQREPECFHAPREAGRMSGRR